MRRSKARSLAGGKSFPSTLYNLPSHLQLGENTSRNVFLLFIFNELKLQNDGPPFAYCLADQYEETVTMAAVENILLSNTTVGGDVPRARSKVQFAPFLVSEIEARISDLAAPREAPPANKDHYERPDETPRAEPDHRAPNDNHVRDDGSKGPSRRTEHREFDEPVDRVRDQPVDRVKDGSVDPVRTAAGDSSEVAPKPANTEIDQVETSEPDHPAAAAENTVTGSSSLQTATNSSAQDFVHEPVDMTGTVTEAPLSVISSSNLVAETIASPTLASAGTTDTSKTNPSVAMAAGTSPAAAAPLAGVPGAGLLSGLATGQASGTPIPGNAADPLKSAGKIDLTGIKPSNDDAPLKIGSDIPQVVREVQSIVSRPANAAGANLVQAHQQGEVPLAQAQNTPAPPTNASPLSQNAGQGTALHVGADNGKNSGQGAGQGAGQNPNGQQSAGQAGSNPAGSAAGQIAGATSDPSTGAASLQTAGNFQQSLARGPGSIGAQALAPTGGDAATTARADGSISSAGSSQGTFASDAANRAAQASAAQRPAPSPATDQVKVSLKKAVENGESKLRIQLRPHDLGKVEVKLDIGGDGRTKALILAERPETLELLQRDSRVLERALQDAGLKTDQNSLSFDLQGREGDERTQQAQQGDDKGNSGGSSSDLDADADVDPNEQPIPATAIGLAPDGSVNFLA
jgi:flagellar hook-length control protein FliK